MKPIELIACLLCATVLAIGGARFHNNTVNAQSAQLQNQPDNRIKQLQSQPPKINTEQEWQAAVKFMQENCPNRANFVANLQGRPVQLERAKELILKQYRQISNSKVPAIHDVMVRQAQIQDVVFGALLQYRAAKNQNDPRKKLEAENQLKLAENELVNVQIDLRKLRITELQAEIEKFQKKRQEYVLNWSKEELQKANSNNIDGTAKQGDADIQVNDDTPPPAVKK